MNELISILTHEYAMALYGVIVYQIVYGGVTKDAKVKGHMSMIAKAMAWAGLVVIFDDELIAQFNKLAEIDYQEMPFWGYGIAGFGIDGIVSYFKK